MFERFTDRARRVLVYAQEEARKLNHAFIGTEHILLGLIQEGDGVAAQALDALGLTYDVAREQITIQSVIATNPFPASPPFTPRAKKVMELALREALNLGHSYIGTEHLLLGIVRQPGCTAERVLGGLGIALSDVQAQIDRLLPDQSDRENAEHARQVIYDGSIFRGVVRAMGEQLRPDLVADELDAFSEAIADDLFDQLRQGWAAVVIRPD